MVAAWLGLAGLVSPSSAAASPDLAPRADCMLVYGHGRNMDERTPKANALWNDLNQIFNQAVAREVVARGRRSLPMVLPVEDRDLQAHTERLLAAARAEGCHQVLETTVFGDPATELLILRLRVHDIVRPAGPPKLDSGLGIGAARSTVQRELPLSARSLERLGGADLVRQMTVEVLGHDNR